MQFLFNNYNKSNKHTNVKFIFSCTIFHNSDMFRSVLVFLIDLIKIRNFDVSLIVRLSINFVNDQLDAQIFNTFITIFYIFPAISCSFLGCQIVLIQHLVSSLSVSDRYCSKYVEDCNKSIKTFVHQVGH